MSLMSLTALELGRRIKNGEVTAVDAAGEALAQIREKEDSIHSFVRMCVRCWDVIRWISIKPKLLT